VHLEVGEPDFDTPAHIKAAGKAAIDANFTHYAPNPGIMDSCVKRSPLRDAFPQLTTPYDRENVVVAPGAKPMIWNLLSALLDPGDEMLYADPAYPTYANCAGYLGAQCRCRCGCSNPRTGGSISTNSRRRSRRARKC
jgi:aspartate aminotransferase